MRIPSAVVGTAVALCLAVAGCEGVVDRGERVHLPLVLTLQLGDGPRIWILDSLTLTVEAGGERHEARRPIDTGVDSWQFAFDVPDEPLSITASVTSTRRVPSDNGGESRGIELLRAVYQGPVSDVINLTLDPVSPILVVELERTPVSPDQPALFLVHNVGIGELAWNVEEVVPGNTCFVGETALPCLQFLPTGGVLGPDGMDSLEVVLRAGEVRSYGFLIDSPPGAVETEVTVTGPPRADLEVRLFYPSGEPAAEWMVAVEGPVFREGETGSNGTVVFPDLPLGVYQVTVPSAGEGGSVLLPVNGARVIVTLVLHDVSG